MKLSVLHNYKIGSFWIVARKYMLYSCDHYFALTLAHCPSTDLIAAFGAAALHIDHDIGNYFMRKRKRKRKRDRETERERDRDRERESTLMAPYLFIPWWYR